MVGAAEHADLAQRLQRELVEAACGGSHLSFARDERHQSELVRLLAKIGAQVGTVIAIQFVFFTRSGGSSTNVGLEPRYLSTSYSCPSARSSR